MAISWVDAGVADTVDPLEDESEDALWRWELRDVKVLPKALRSKAQELKRNLHKVSYPSSRPSALQLQAELL